MNHLARAPIRQTFLEDASWASSGSRTAGSTFAGPPGLPRAAAPPDTGTHFCSPCSPLGGEAHPGVGPSLWSSPRSALPTEMATFKQNWAGLTRKTPAGSCLHGTWLPAPTMDPWCDLGLKCTETAEPSVRETAGPASSDPELAGQCGDGSRWPRACEEEAGMHRLSSAPRGTRIGGSVPRAS